MRGGGSGAVEGGSGVVVVSRKGKRNKIGSTWSQKLWDCSKRNFNRMPPKCKAHVVARTDKPSTPPVVTRSRNSKASYPDPGKGSAVEAASLLDLQRSNADIRRLSISDVQLEIQHTGSSKAAAAFVPLTTPTLSSIAAASGGKKIANAIEPLVMSLQTTRVDITKPTRDANCGVCRHGRPRSNCHDCGGRSEGSGFCEHVRVKRISKDSELNGFCQHWMQMNDCKECAGKREVSGVCEHGRRRAQCRESGVCVGVRPRSRAICLTRFLEDKARHVPPRTKAYTVCGM